MQPLSVLLPTLDVIVAPVPLAVIGLALMALGITPSNDSPAATVFGTAGILGVVLAAFADPAAVGGLFLILLGTGVAAYGLSSIDWTPLVHAYKRMACRHFGHSMGDGQLPVGFIGNPAASCTRCGIGRAALIRAAVDAPPIPRLIHDPTTATGVVLNGRQSAAAGSGRPNVIDLTETRQQGRS